MFITQAHTTKALSTCCVLRNYRNAALRGARGLQRRNERRWEVPWEFEGRDTSGRVALPLVPFAAGTSGDSGDTLCNSLILMV